MITFSQWISLYRLTPTQRERVLKDIKIWNDLNAAYKSDAKKSIDRFIEIVLGTN